MSVRKHVQNYMKHEPQGPEIVHKLKNLNTSTDISFHMYMERGTEILSTFSADHRHRGDLAFPKTVLLRAQVS